MSTTDSEDDGDYVPPVEADSSSSNDEPDSKHRRIASPLPEQDGAEKKEIRDALWSSFQASLSETPARQESPKELIKIEKRYKFAGENVVEVVEVPIDSPDAAKWPLWIAPGENKTPSEVASDSSVVRKAPTNRPGPRKPKVSLASLPTPSSQKAKKISTLDKSVMDWRAHVQGSEAGIKDELEANRRTGGYIEKMEFLSRVEERKADVLEANKGSKRRRP